MQINNTQKKKTQFQDVKIERFSKTLIEFTNNVVKKQPKIKDATKKM